MSALARPATAQIPDSLWIGTDNIDTRNVLNTDRAGHVFRTIGPLDATGFAIDLAANTIYFGASDRTITPRDLTTLAPGPSFSPAGTPLLEDMTYDGSSIWRCDHGARDVRRIDPSTGDVTFTFSPGFDPLGIAWDGSDLWISELTAGGRVERFTRAGTDTGQGFRVSASIVAGGLAFDPTDSTLWIGTDGNVFHYSLAGVTLGGFAIPADQDPGRFVDGLEFEGTPALAKVPEPDARWFLIAAGLSSFLCVLSRLARRSGRGLWSHMATTMSNPRTMFATEVSASSYKEGA